MGDETKGRQTSALDRHLAILLEQFQRGKDSDALGRIVESCAAEVFRVACSVLREEDGAREVSQVVFCKFIKHCSGIRRGDSLRAWLRRTAFREAIHERKRRSKYPLPLELFEDIYVSIDPGQTPLESVLTKEMAEKVHAAVRRLPERQRVCVEISLKHLNPPEAAATLGMTLSTYYANLSRARVNLRRMLRDSL